MARRRDVEAAARAAGMGDDDVARLTEKLYRTKLRVYRDTLRVMADRFTRNGPPDRIPLSDSVKDGLRAEAERHAEKIANAHNEALGKHALKISSHGDGKTKAKLTDELTTFGRDRMRGRAEMIAVTEAYGPHADATIGFFRDAGIEPEFEFGGHPDDSAPACDICRAIVARNPHSLRDVVAIGVPHPFCRQSWHPLFNPADLPNEFDLGATLGGIVGAPTLVHREGSVAAAAEAVAALRE